MTTNHDPEEEAAVRATRAAMLEIGDFSPLTRMQAMVIACLEVWKAGQAMSINQPIAERELWMKEAATREIIKSMAEKIASQQALERRRAELIAGIDTLPWPQQLAISLRFEYAMNLAEIAAVMNTTQADVEALIAAAKRALREV